MDPSGRRGRHRPGRCGLVIEFLHEHPNDDHHQASSGVARPRCRAGPAAACLILRPRHLP